MYNAFQSKVGFTSAEFSLWTIVLLSGCADSGSVRRESMAAFSDFFPCVASWHKVEKYNTNLKKRREQCQHTFQEVPLKKQGGLRESKYKC